MNLRIKTSVATAVFALGLAAPAFAAPLSFPDVPANHWAKDAVETLAAKHIIEGYPDGTFKGDRASTRWEVAMVVARLLKQIEDGQSNFATKQDLEAINRLANSLKDELEALGQRVNKLEGDVNKLDQRVTELERITFYGSAEARFVGQCFTTRGASQLTNNDSDIALEPGSMDYEHQAGTFAAANAAALNNFGVLPVADYARGTALTNGTGFSMKAILGLRIRVSDDVDAGAEFAAYSSAGDSIANAFWGVQAPHSCNFATGDSTNQWLGSGNKTFTRMVLDNFWVMHNPSGTKLTLGAITEDHIDDILFAGSPNFGYFGNNYNDRFGFDVNGSTKLWDWGVFRWELMGTRLPNGSGVLAVANDAGINPYNTNVLAADLGVEFGAGQVKVNFMHAANESQSGSQYHIGAVGLADATGDWMNGLNMATGIDAVGFNGMNGTLQWVNPAGYYANGGATADAFAAGGGDTTLIDDRPITNGNTAVDNGIGTFGPQQMVGFSVKADYKWDIGDSGDQIYAAGQYARTEYKANKNANYVAKGNAYKAEVGANLLDGDLDVALNYTGTDPNYDPFVNVNPYISGYSTMNSINYINMNQYSNMWSMHDVNEFTHNRKGIGFDGQWRFDDRRGMVWAKAKFLTQTRKSLYDNRVVADPATNGFTADVMGFNPGFMDPVFYGYASPLVYGAQSANSFVQDAATHTWELADGVDNKAGTHTNWGIGANYKWENPRLKLDLGYESNTYKRDVGGVNGELVAFGANQNYVNLRNGVLHAGLGWEANDKWTLRLGCDWANVSGHWDPSGQYNNFAQHLENNGQNGYDFDNIKVNQIVPYIGFDYDMTANTQWNLDLRYYETRDGVNASTYAGDTTNTVDAASANYGTYAGYTAHPFSWYGWQVTSQFKIKF